MALALGCSSTFANEATGFPKNGKDSVNREIKEVFNRQFRNADDVIWTKIGSYQKASFKIENYHVDAFYTVDGDLAGYCRHISNEQLPLAITMHLSKRFKYQAWFSNIIEVSNEKGNCYWLTVIARMEKIRVHVNPQGNVMQVVKMPF